MRLANLIDGRLQAPANDRYLDVFEPATGAVFAHCPDGNVHTIVHLKNLNHEKDNFNFLAGDSLCYCPGIPKRLCFREWGEAGFFKCQSHEDVYAKFPAS